MVQTYSVIQIHPDISHGDVRVNLRKIASQKSLQSTGCFLSCWINTSTKRFFFFHKHELEYI